MCNLLSGSRLRGDAECQLRQMLFDGLVPCDSSFDVGGCERIARLAYLVRPRGSPYSPSPEALPRRGLGAELDQYGLGARCHHNRSLLGSVRLGAVSLDQGCGQDAYAASGLHPHQRWQAARGQCARFPTGRSRRLLRHGPCLPRLRPALSDASSPYFLRNPGEARDGCQVHLFHHDRQDDWRDLRPTYCHERLLRG